MTIIAIVPMLICVLGLLMYLMSANPKASDVGRIMFACGLLVSLLYFAGRTIHI